MIRMIRIPWFVYMLTAILEMVKVDMCFVFVLTFHIYTLDASYSNRLIVKAQFEEHEARGFAEKYGYRYITKVTKFII